MPELHLPGCRSRPLIGYLKAVGVLRTVTRSADGEARARWEHGRFLLRSRLSRAELEQHFLFAYSPSPILSPWNGRSGFYARGNATAVEAVHRIEGSADERVATYRALIARTRAILDQLGITEKPSDRQKEVLIRRLRREWPDDAVEWIDTAVVLIGQKAAFPPLLGSGGNDGSYDFSSNYLQSIASTLLSDDVDSSSGLLAASLFEVPARLSRIALAHFRTDASPTNSASGMAKSLGNPWDLVFAVEGTLLLAGGVARRHGAATGGMLVAPFTTRSTAAGYGSAAVGERSYAELWLPLWSGWASHAEIQTLVRESRAQVSSGSSRRSARTGLDFARAVGELGVARGIEAFERYAILERAGQARLAVPTGRLSITPRPGSAALGSIDPWLTRTLRFGHSDRCPRSPRAAIHRLERAAFQLAARGDPSDATAAIEAIGATEHTLALSGRRSIEAELRPLQHIDAVPWIEAADDGSPEFSVAVSLASLHDPGAGSGPPALRDYLHGTVEGGRAFDVDRRHHIDAVGPVPVLAAIHARRHLDAARTQSDDSAGERPRNGADRQQRRRLGFARGTWCDASVARLFATGALDDGRILRLVKGLALFDHRGLRRAVPQAPSFPAAPAYELLALAWTESSSTSIARAREGLGPRPGWAARLAADSPRTVVEDAARRLQVAGLVPISEPNDLLAASPSGPRLAAALLLPLESRYLQTIARERTIRAEPTKPNHTWRRRDDRWTSRRTASDPEGPALAGPGVHVPAGRLP